MDRWLSCTARFFESYLRRVSRTVSVRIFVDDGAETRPFSDESPLDSLSTELLSYSTVLLPLWNAHSVLLLSSYLSSSLLAHAAQRFEAVADDSLGGQFSQLLYRRISLPGRQLSIRSAEDRLEDLRKIVNGTPPLVMAADSHGPYREISPGMARLARSYHGLVRPVSSVCDRAIHVFPRIRIAIPRARSRIVVLFGAPLRHAESMGVVRASLSQTLRMLETQAHALL